MAGRHRDKDNRSPAMLASLTLHALLFGSAFLTLPFLTSPVKEVPSVPITLVTHVPPELSEAEAAAKAEQAAAPDVAPTVVAPEAAPPPTPAPSVPQPKPTPTPPKPTSPKPAPAPNPTPKPTVKPLDLAALASSLPQTKAAKAPAKPSAKPFDLGALAASLPKRPSAPTKGVARPAVDLSKIAGPAKPLSGDEMGPLQAKLGRLWLVNCMDEAASKAVVRVEMRLTPDGHLASPPTLVDHIAANPGSPAQQALIAVRRGEPYSDVLQRDRYESWKDIIFRFDAKTNCGPR